jgi:hypothetical protein
MKKTLLKDPIDLKIGDKFSITESDKPNWEVKGKLGAKIKAQHLKNGNVVESQIVGTVHVY